MKQGKIKFDQYTVRGKHRDFQVIVFPKKKYMWAYYEDFDKAYEIDGDSEAYRQMKYAMAILAADPNKIIYLPIRNQPLGNICWDVCYDAVLCRPELQLRRSEWVRLRRQLNCHHQVENYVLHYMPKKLCDEWNKIENSLSKYDCCRREKQEAKTMQDDTVFMVLLKETCLQYHSRIVELMKGGVPEYPSYPVGELGWILSPRAIREAEEKYEKSKRIKTDSISFL